jgi:CubicO group peptidase (beta-lactamase class C family)
MMENDADFNRLVLSLLDKYGIHAAGYALIDAYKVARVETISDSIGCDTSSLFQACSLSKSITAYAVLDLVAQNKIQLDSPINMYLDSWKISDSPYSDLVTARHCLNMTSGLCFGVPGTAFAGYSREALIPTLSEILCGKAPATNLPVKVVFEIGIIF